MNRTIADNNLQPEVGPETTFRLTIFGLAFLVIAIILAYVLKNDSAIELPSAPGQTFLFFDIINNKI
mgnify:CR=1 FL=1